jgi:aryl-alcohol dehydrogenase-like predicted oxidoreductase
MRYKLLGNSGLRVSQLCLGTMTFGEDWGWGASRDESKAMFDAFAAAGGNFIDTANVYTNGTSEKLVGEFIHSERDRFVLATKYSLNMDAKGNPNAAGNSRRNMMLSVEQSLRRLNTDYVDLYWMHIWDQSTPAEEVMRGFDDLVRQGKILYAGVSDTPAWWVAHANTLAHLRGWTPFVALQIEYSLIERTVERELIPMAQAYGMAVTPWAPLGGGILTGKYSSGDEKTTRGGKISEERRAIADAVVAVAKEIGAKPSQVALAWLFAQPGTVIPIVGATKSAQLIDNLASVDVKLTTDQVLRLDEASKIDLGFPGRFYAGDAVNRLAHGGMRSQIDWTGARL